MIASVFALSDGSRWLPASAEGLPHALRIFDQALTGKTEIQSGNAQEYRVSR